MVLADLARKVLDRRYTPTRTFRDHATANVHQGVRACSRRRMSLNPQVYQALSVETPHVSRADAASRYYVQHQMPSSDLAVLDKDAATRQRLKKLNDQSHRLATNRWFERNIADDLKTIDVTPSELEGLPQDYIDAHKPGADGRIQITTK